MVCCYWCLTWSYSHRYCMNSCYIKTKTHMTHQLWVAKMVSINNDSAVTTSFLGTWNVRNMIQKSCIWTPVVRLNLECIVLLSQTWTKYKTRVSNIRKMETFLTLDKYVGHPQNGVLQRLLNVQRDLNIVEVML